MYTLAMFKELYRHMHWADAEVWRAVLAHSEATADTKLKSTLYHSHLTQLAFVKIWTAAPMEFPQETSFADLPAVCAWAQDIADQQDRYLQQIKESDLPEVVHIPWLVEFEKRIGQKPVNGSLGETLLQVPMHTQHHRGQVCSRLRSLAAEPPLVDFIAWVWRGKPAVKWPGVAGAAQ